MNQSPSESLVHLDGPGSRPGAWSSQPRAGWRRMLLQLALAGVAVNLLLFISLAAFVSASMAGVQKTMGRVLDAQQPESTHLVIDNGRLQLCPTSPTIVGDSGLPCLQKDGRYLTSDEALGPWKCATSGRDKGSSNCLLAAANGSRIEVLKQGLYLLVVQTLVVDSLPSPVALLASVNSINWAACAHNATGSQLPCTITAVRRMQSGDWLTLRVPQAYRLIDSHYTLTYIDLMRLGN